MYITLKSRENKLNSDSAGLDGITLCVYNLEIRENKDNCDSAGLDGMSHASISSKLALM